MVVFQEDVSVLLKHEIFAPAAETKVVRDLARAALNALSEALRIASRYERRARSDVDGLGCSAVAEAVNTAQRSGAISTRALESVGTVMRPPKFDWLDDKPWAQHVHPSTWLDNIQVRQPLVHLAEIPFSTCSSASRRDCSIHSASVFWT
ncbi:hypothetical protein BC835DRAFT_993619 [Cytidiella melzeri]|nr:hypothetical protein BC835DRAFT_993619 [Cytidiella melzeri]